MSVDNKSLRLLVIDDDQQIHDIFALRLRNEGYQIDCALCGEEALPLVKTERYDLIFVDNVMPGMDAVETCKSIKKIRPEAILIYMTGVFSRENTLKEAEFLKAGGRTYYLYKPFAQGELQEVIQKALKEGNNP